MPTTRNITFTRWLQKLVGIRVDQPVSLIHCSKTNLGRLSGHFIRYDTRFTKDRGFYNLEGYNDIILLIFMDCEGLIFTTLRPYTLDKLNYYQTAVGAEFNVVIREGIEGMPELSFG